MLVLRIDGVVADVDEKFLSGGSTMTSLDIKNFKPHQDAWYWINHYSSTYDIMFITERDKSFTNVTWEWFREWDIPVDFIVFDTDELEFIQQINPDLFIDVNPSLVSSLASSGIESFLIDRSFNAGPDLGERRIISIWDIKCV